MAKIEIQYQLQRINSTVIQIKYNNQSALAWEPRLHNPTKKQKRQSRMNTITNCEASMANPISLRHPTPMALTQPNENIQAIQYSQDQFFNNQFNKYNPIPHKNDFKYILRHFYNKMDIQYT